MQNLVSGWTADGKLATCTDNNTTCVNHNFNRKRTYQTQNGNFFLIYIKLEFLLKKTLNLEFLPPLFFDYQYIPHFNTSTRIAYFA
jgi:hypothetical protein